MHFYNIFTLWALAQSTWCPGSVVHFYNESLYRHGHDLLDLQYFSLLNQQIFLFFDKIIPDVYTIKTATLIMFYSKPFRKIVVNEPKMLEYWKHGASIRWYLGARCACFIEKVRDRRWIQVCYCWRSKQKPTTDQIADFTLLVRTYSWDTI